ncbi:hypothetical protein QL285_025446 [Trifolium repens]|nr:hypothetical protein QL285_025446 [Trifolium repens]
MLNSTKTKVAFNMGKCITFPPCTSSVSTLRLNRHTDFILFCPHYIFFTFSSILLTSTNSVNSPTNIMSQLARNKFSNNYGIDGFEAMTAAIEALEISPQNQILQ